MELDHDDILSIGYALDEFKLNGSGLVRIEFEKKENCEKFFQFVTKFSIPQLLDEHATVSTFKQAGNKVFLDLKEKRWFFAHSSSLETMVLNMMSVKIDIDLLEPFCEKAKLHLTSEKFGL